MNHAEYLARIEDTIRNGKYKDAWASLSGHKTPEWYYGAKLGIFIHWGVYSVPAYSCEWYPRLMYDPAHHEYEYHRKTYGSQKEFGYKDFIPMFRGEKFDADEWVSLFRRAGARYVMPVCEHHDGFAMYDTEFNRWNAARMGPCRDVIGELRAAAEENGLYACVSTHRAEYWWFMSHGKEFDSDVREPLRRGDFYWPAMPERDFSDIHSEPAPSPEYLDDWLLRTVELVDRFHPRMLYFDWWIQHTAFEPYLKRFAAYYYNTSLKSGFVPVIAYKHDSFMYGSALRDIERGQLADIQANPWQTDMACALNSWCYTVGNQYRKAADIVCDLMDIVSKNGNLLLNVGPRADGSIGPEDRTILKEIGAFLRDNGEAVYRTRPWRVCGEGPTRVQSGFFTDGIRKEFTSADFRFTQKGASVYAAALRPSEDGTYLCRTFRALREPAFDGLHRDILQVSRPDGKAVHWQRGEQGLTLRTAPGGDMPVVFRLALG